MQFIAQGLLCQCQFKSDPPLTFKRWLIIISSWLKSVPYQLFSYSLADSLLLRSEQCEHDVITGLTVQRLTSCHRRKCWPKITGDDDTALLLAFGNDIKEQISFLSTRWQIAYFVNDEQPRC